MRVAQEFPARALERVRRRRGRVPLGDDVVVRDVGDREARRDEVRRRRIAGRALAVDRVQQPVLRELGVEREADEAALEPVVHGEREDPCDVQVQRRRVAAVQQIQEAARVVGEAASVGQVAHVADACPAGRRDVLVGGPQAAGLR